MNHYKNGYKLCQKFTYSAPKHLPAVSDERNGPTDAMRH